MKKFISLYLIAIMIINIINPITVYAALPDIELNHNKFLEALTEGSKSSTPDHIINNTYALPAENVFFAWDFNLMMSGSYELYYPIDDNKTARFTVRRTGGRSATVEFQLEDGTVGSAKPGTTPPKGGNLKTELYEIYSNNNMPGSKNYIPFENYMVPESGYNINNSNGVKIVRDKNDDTIPYTAPYGPETGPDACNYYPYFNIAPGYGLSFNYDQYNIQFSWDENGQFYFETSGIKKDRIYEFTLTYWEGLSSSPTVIKTSKRKIFAGFDITSYDKFKVQPYANSGKTNSYDERIDKSVNKEMDPGMERVDLDITFNMPYEWDETAHTFSKLPDTSTTKYKLPLFMNFHGATREIELAVDNLLAENPKITNSAWLNEGTGKAPFITPIFETGTKELKSLMLSLSNLSPSQMYSSVSMTIGNDETENLYCRGTSVPFGRIYTYIHYGVNETGNDYYIWFYPYRSDRIGVTNQYKGTYSLYRYPNMITPLMSMETDGSKTIEQFPLAFNPDETIESTYRIVFTPSTTSRDVASQYLVFEPSFMPPIGLVENFKASVASMTPKSSVNNDESDLILKLMWDIGTINNINYYFKNNPDSTLFATYEFKRGMTPDDKNPVPFAQIGIEITQDKTTSPSSLNVKFIDKNEAVIGHAAKLYSPEEGKAVTEYPETGKTQKVIQSMGRYMVEMQIIIDSFRRLDATVNDNTMYFLYPGVYFINTTPIYVKDVINDGPVNVASSLYSSITINDIAPDEISPPQNLKAESPVLTETEASFKLSWEIAGAGLQKYLKSRFKAPITNEVNAFMNLYISSNEELMRETFTEYNTYKDTTSTNKNDRILNNDTYEVTYNGKDELDDEGKPIIPRIFFSGINNNSLTIETPGDYLGKEARDALRNGKVTAIVNIPIRDDYLKAIYDSGYDPPLYEIIIDGLDANEIYYAYADLIVDAKNEEHTEVSKLSNLVSITLKGDLVAPTGKDKVPPVPEVEIVDVGLKEATLRWKPIEDNTEDGIIEYEIIRLKDTQMPNAYLDTKDEFENIWKILPENKLGLKTNIKDDELLLFNGNGFNEKADSEKYIPSLQTDPMWIKDVTLFPNQIYFYYIRTVKTVPGQETMYSAWSRVTATTDTVKAPKELKINDTEKIDQKTEVIIEFDAPAIPSELGIAYNLQYQIKKNTDPWSEAITMQANALRGRNPVQLAAPEDDYWHYSYKITGLDPATGYQIRVRMVDMNGDASMYSNIAEFRTETRQEDLNEEKEINDAIDRIKELLEKLLKDPYWFSRKNSSEWEIIYRPDRFAALLTAATDSALNLAVPPASEAEGVNRLTYYIPASALASANAANKGFKVKHGGMEVLLSPKAVSEAYNEAIIKMGDEIKLKNAADYYFRIQMQWSDNYNQINGANAVSKQVQVSMDIVGSTQLISTVDAELMAELSVKVASKIDDKKLREQIRQNIRSNMIDEDLVKYFEKIVDDSREEFLTIVNNKLRSTSKFSNPVTKLDYPLIIIASGIDSTNSVSAYTLNNNEWMPTDVTPFGENKAIYSYTPGTFVFTGREVKIDGIDTMKYGGNIHSIVTKYGLDDFLGADGKIDMNEAADRNMVIQSIARMAGAPKGADALKWLKDNMNMTVSSRNMNQNITTEESVYLVMSLYEAKSNTKISTIKIKNYGATQNIAGINDNYKQYIRVAFELGIYSNAQMQPKGTISIKDLFEMLGKLDAKLKL